MYMSTKTWINLTKNWIILLQLVQKHIHKVNFYPSDNNFTQALLVMLVTNMISAAFTISILFRLCTATTYYIFTPDLKRLCCPSTWYSTSCSIDVERSASSSPPSCPSAPSSAPTSSNVCSDNGSTNGSTNSCIACTCALPVPVSPGAVFGCQQSGAAPGQEPLMPAVQPQVQLPALHCCTATSPSTCASTCACATASTSSAQDREQATRCLSGPTTAPVPAKPPLRWSSETPHHKTRKSSKRGKGLEILPLSRSHAHANVKGGEM